MNTIKVLFILKKRYVAYQDPATHIPYAYHLSSGLLNSATFVKDMLVQQHIEAKLVEVNDNNDIDREVHAYRPTHVVIEAYWVVPEKFAVLTRLHPTVKWIVRMHSDLPFLASEGIAMDWTQRYVAYPNVSVAANSMRVVEDFRMWLAIRYPTVSRKDLEASISYLPNYYPVSTTVVPSVLDTKDTIDIGCFGAVRPMKNHLIQAFAAIKIAQKVGKHLRFHINVSRIEGRGETALENVRSLFKPLAPQFKLVEHLWMEHDVFKKLVTTMDLGLQVSFSETFNIVAADFVDMDIPIVVSPEIQWMPTRFMAHPTDSDDIVDKAIVALAWKKFMPRIDVNRTSLRKYVTKSAKIWNEYFYDD